ncbi:MAG: phosphatidylcholine/phosphatidylserine synthase, partial [Lachnospiraceae bacterium]|nr:phosphatidylcholine/phosphatidylserine synthase [Lachnospiraceae bacterium]
DGAVARKIKRTEEEKAFGIELDSLADVISFVVFPIIIFCRLGYLSVAHLVVYLLFAVAGIARLGYFNVTTADSEGPVKHYMGLPVTYTALIFPIFYPLAALAENYVPTYYSLPVCMLAVAFLEVLKVKVAKPKGIAYAIVSFFAILYIVYYLVSAH